ncbi:DUF4347 domain-containing protein, partial [Laspinema olomoucense]|uniref:DUF4347 domain-containing protein n=1 Tax=Laspinema olomoucense TaxID=3231600 RepID=UPI0021BAC891
MDSVITQNKGRFSSPKSLVFIDSNVENYLSLIPGVWENFQAIVLDEFADGVQQITEVLESLMRQGQPVESLHIISHGSPGCLRLGKVMLSADNLCEFQESLQSWSRALIPQGNLFLYGCQVAAGIGAEFVRTLSRLTGVNIAASVDMTGNSERGGNWDLAFRTGEITAPLALKPEAMMAYSGVLAILTVTNANDSGAGSLRNAIASAQGGDTILFDSSLANQTITLTSGQLELNKDLTIDGSNAAGITISGNNASRVFWVSNFRTVNLANLNLINGKTLETGIDGSGGAIYTRSRVNLNIENVNFRNNFTRGEGGGAIATGNSSNITITGSIFDGNDATASQSERGGGAISTFGNSILTVKNSQFLNNKGINGGAINTASTLLNVENSTFINNDTTAGASINQDLRGFGGAIFTDGVSASFGGTSGTSVIRSSRFEGNIGVGKGGAVFFFIYGENGDKGIVEDSIFVNNIIISDYLNQALGGGLRLGNGDFTVRNTTFYNNVSQGQGGGLWIDNKSPTTIINSTFSGNKSENSDGTGGVGGGITTFSPTTIVNTTIVNNQAGDVAGAIFTSLISPPITLSNTIVSNNTAGNGLSRFQQTRKELIDGGNNIQFPSKNLNDPQDVNVTANVRIADPLLGPLQEIDGV